MMDGKKENQLIIIENEQLRTFALDVKEIWEVGRLSSNSKPDIQLYSPTVSRKHGKFQNMDGIWFYLDYNGKNGTIFNHKHIHAGIKGRVKPMMLRDGDVLIFGGGEEESINYKTIWALFLQNLYPGGWRVASTKGVQQLRFFSDDQESRMQDPKKGTVIKCNAGIAIYMGDQTYMTGDVKIAGV